MSVKLRTSAGDLPVLNGSLVESIRGNWFGTFGLHGTTAPAEGSSASIVFARESGAENVFAGTVRRVGRSAGSVAISVSLVGGAGKLLAELAPRDHAPGTTQIPAGLVAKGIAADAGEQLAAGVEAALDGRTLRRWTRIAMPGRDALDELADALGWGWRVMRDGKIWIGAETWPALDATRFLSAVPDELGAVYATDGAPIRPGVTLSTPEGERRIVEVVYTVSAGAQRATVRAVVPGDPRPVRESRELYLATYAGTVQAQDANDGSVEVVPDDPRLGDASRPLRGVPLQCGIPGARITYTTPAGERVRLAFEGGDPRGVFALPAHDQDTSTPTKQVARRGDFATGLFALLLSPGAQTLTLVANGTPGSITLDSRIVTGSPEVKIR